MPGLCVWEKRGAGGAEPAPRLAISGRRAMAFTVEDLRDLAELLRAHPEWREPL